MIFLIQDKKSDTSICPDLNSNTSKVSMESGYSTESLLNRTAFKAQRNIAKMILFTCIIYLCGNLPETITFLVAKYSNHFWTMACLYFSIFTLFVSHSVTTLVYYFYDRKFRKIVKHGLKCSRL